MDIRSKKQAMKAMRDKVLLEVSLASIELDFDGELKDPRWAPSGEFEVWSSSVTRKIYPAFDVAACAVRALQVLKSFEHRKQIGVYVTNDEETGFGVTLACGVAFSHCLVSESIPAVIVTTPELVPTLAKFLHNSCPDMEVVFVADETGEFPDAALTADKFRRTKLPEVFGGSDVVVLSREFHESHPSSLKSGLDLITKNFISDIIMRNMPKPHPRGGISVEHFLMSGSLASRELCHAIGMGRCDVTSPMLGRALVRGWIKMRNSEARLIPRFGTMVHPAHHLERVLTAAADGWEYLDELERIAGEYKKFADICYIWDYATRFLGGSEIRGKVLSTSEYGSMAGEFEEIGEALGIGDYIRAYESGVPVEDLMA